jgi:hypothetical protein
MKDLSLTEVYFLRLSGSGCRLSRFIKPGKSIKPGFGKIILLTGMMLAGLCLQSHSQEVDSLRIVTATDSTGKMSDVPGKNNFVKNFFTKNYPNPRKAALFAAVLPGSGQIYNRKWWKVPIVYAALGGMTWWTADNVRQYRVLRDEYKARVDENPATAPNPIYARLDNQTIRDYRDLFRKYSEQSYIGLSFVYLLSITDAFVDAHMYRFDVSEDLSLQLQPKANATPGFGLSVGLGVSLGF